MADRKKTPDIMVDLLGGSPPQPTIKPEYHNTGIPADQPTIKPERKRPAPQVKTAPEEKPPAQATREKVKATFYISADIVDRLEDGWSELRKISPKEARGEISKSFIVETALLEALDGLARSGRTSLLAKKAGQISKKTGKE